MPVRMQTIELRDLRIAAAGMLGVALLWPALPAHPPNVCPLRSTTGIPCPFCRMTRAVLAAVHGHLMTSLRFNPAGVVVVLVAIVLIAGYRATRVRIPSWLLPVALALMWAWNLTLNPTFH